MKARHLAPNDAIEHPLAIPALESAIGESAGQKPTTTTASDVRSGPSWPRQATISG